jgi:hypothetical protein
MANFFSGLAQTAVRAAPFAAKVLADKRAAAAAQRKELLAQLHQQSLDNTANIDALTRGSVALANIRNLDARTAKLAEPTPAKPTEFEMLDTPEGFVRVPKAGPVGPVTDANGQPYRKRVVAPAQPRDSYAFPTVMGPDGNPVVARANTRTGDIEPTDIGAKPTGGKSTASLTKAIAANQQQLSYIDQAIAAVKKHPQAFGLGRGLPLVGSTIDQRIDPEGVKARSLISNIGSMQIHDRTGAAMSVHEEKRLAGFVPQTSDTPDKIIENLQQLKAGLAETNDALQHSGTPTGDSGDAEAAWAAKNPPKAGESFEAYHARYVASQKGGTP